jgi:hypothetical protein
MAELNEYIRDYADRHPVGTVAGATNVVFFEVRAKEAASAEQLRALLSAHVSEFEAVDVFDGREHGYIELGGWLGSQGDALALIGLGEQLGLWKLLSPRTMLGDLITPEQEKAMAGSGLVSLQATRKPAPATA